MTLPATMLTKISNVSNNVKTHISNLISTHSNISGSSTTKGHVQSSTNAGYADVSGGAVGTDNGIYARADHQHALSDAYATANHTHSNYLTSSDLTSLNNRVMTLEGELEDLEDDLLA